MTDLVRLRRLADAIRASADPLPEWWEEAFFRAPRDQFVPDVIWQPDVDGWPRPLQRSTDPEGWADSVYRDECVITQVDAGRPLAPGAHGEEATSSCSMPNLVFEFMAYAGVQKGDQVLEVGTGTGWSSALMTAHLGDEQVTTVELDPSVASRAAANLASVNLRPTTVVGDGSLGYAPNAPYDRVIATCAARRVPYSWVEQTRPGGVIVAPFGTLFLGHQVMVRLVAAGDGTASGSFLDHHVDFMGLRHESASWRHISEIVRDRDRAAVSETDMDPTLVLPARHGGGNDIAFVIGLRVPGVEFRRLRPDDGPENVWFFVAGADGRAESWARVRYAPDWRRFPVEQHGPRRLWDEIERAVTWFVTANEPRFDDFGMTVTKDGSFCWHSRPDGDEPWPVV